MKNIEGITNGTANANKGLILPRVSLSDKYQLYPMFLEDSTDPTSGPNSNYLANKATLDKTHIGLVVYNTVEDDAKELCLGANVWDGDIYSMEFQIHLLEPKLFYRPTL